MFLGEYLTRFTGKGRIILPKKIRENIASEVLILSRGFEECIWGFSLTDWEKEAGKQLETSITEKKGRDLRRFFFSASESLEFDNQGRIVIPVHLLQFAKLKDEVMVIGAGDHFEIWDKNSWQQHIRNLENDNSQNI